MNLDQALAWAHQKYLDGARSDGCTFAPDLGIKRFCYMHDFLLRYKPVSALRADNLFFQGIWSKGWRYFPVAVLYWLAVRWTSISRLPPSLSVALLGYAALVYALIKWG